MVEVYRVGVTLRLVDEATPALRRLIGALGVANEAAEKLRATLTDLAGTRMAGLSRSMLGVEKRLTGIADAGEQMGATVGASFDRLGIGVGALRTELAGVAAEMKGIAAESRAIRAFSAGGAGGGRSGAGHGAGGLHGRVPVGPMHAGFGVSAGAAAGLLAGFGMYEGIKSAASEQLAMFYTVLASGMDPTSPTGRAFAAKVRDTAEQTSLGTIFSRLDVAKMMPGIAGKADVPLAQALPFMRSAIQFGEIERQFGASIGHDFDAQESASAAIVMSHLLGISDPSKMLPVLNMMAPATTTSGKSPAQLVNVLQYMLGAAAGVGMSNEEAMNLGTLGATLMPGTRAGTNLNMMLTGLIPKAGPGAGTRIAQTRKRAALLSEMGLVDPKTGQLYKDAEGGTLLPLIEHLHAFQMAHPKEAMGDYIALFQQRGARAAYEIGRNPKMEQMAKELESREASFVKMGGIPAVQAKQNETLANQALRSWSDLKTILLDLGETTVPALTVGFKALNTGLEGIRSFLGAHQDIATALGFGGLGLGTLAGAKVLLTIAGAIGRLGASPFALAAGGLASVTAAIAGLAAVAGAFKLAYDWLKADEKGSPAAGRAVHPSVAAAAAAAAVLGAPQYSGGVGRGVHVLVPGGAVRPPGMQQHGAAGSGVFGDLGGAVLGELKTMSAHLAEAKNVTLTGVTNLTGEVRLSVEGFADMIGRMVAKGIQHAVTGLSGSGARPAQMSYVGPT